MTNRPGSPGQIGRNDPCPCGSGKKYKRCCKKREASEPPDEMDAADVLGLALDEPVEVAHAWYDVDDVEAARELIGAMDAAQGDGEGFVLVGPFDEGPPHPLAWVQFGEGEVRVVAPNGWCLLEARALIEQEDDRGLLYHVRSNIGDVRATLELLAADREREGLQSADIEGEVRALLTTTMRCYYERWVAAPNVALEGRSPRQVVSKRKEPNFSMLIGILALLDEQEAAAPWADGVAYDFGEVWRMLELDRDDELDLGRAPGAPT